MPDIDFSNVTKLILGCVSKITSFEIYFKQMPKLEYFGYIFYTHYVPEEKQEELNPSAWDIVDNFLIKHFEVTVSQPDMVYHQINNAALAHFISKLKFLNSLKTNVLIGIIIS